MTRYRSYDPFAWFYDLYWAKNYVKDCRAGLENVFLPRLRPKARVLDLCCGSGRLAHWLTGCGFRVTGLDGSEAMLELARRRAPTAEFVVGDARDFRFDNPFDAVVSTFDSMNHLATVAELEGVFANVSRSLVPRGLFFFDLNTHEGFESSADETFAAVRKEHVCIAKSRYDRKKGVGAAEITMFVADGDGWKRSDARILEYHHSLEGVRAALRNAGLEPSGFFKADEDLGMPRAWGRVFLLAEKSG